MNPEQWRIAFLSFLFGGVASSILAITIWIHILATRDLTKQLERKIEYLRLATAKIEELQAFVDTTRKALDEYDLGDGEEEEEGERQ